MTSSIMQVIYTLRCHDMMLQMVGFIEVTSLLHAELQIYVVAFLKSMVVHLRKCEPAKLSKGLIA